MINAHLNTVGLSSVNWVVYRSQFSLRVTFARWRNLATLQITLENFSIFDIDFTRIYLRFHAKFGPAGLRGWDTLRIYTSVAVSTKP